MNSMLKLVLCLVIVVSSTLVGFSFSSKLYKRKQVLSMFVRELNKAGTSIRYSQSSLASIFTKKFDGYIFDDNKDFYMQWKQMLEQYDKTLKYEDIRTLESFSAYLGTNDAEGAVNSIKMYLELLENSIKEAENNIVLKSKLYRTLGLSLGLVVSILLL